MNHTEENLQDKIDRGNSMDEGMDALAYQKVFDTLKREPEYTLPVYFADRLISLIESKEKVRESSRDNLWLGLGLFSLIIVLIIASVLTDFKMSAGAFQFLASYPGLFFFGTAFILFLNWVDKKIIRKVDAF